MSIRATLRSSAVVFLCLVVAILLFGSFLPASANRLGDGKYLYIASPGQLRIYRFGTWDQVARYSLPHTTDGIRGVDADPADHSLYIAHGGDGGAHGPGSLLKWNLMTQTVSWDRSYPFGIDQFSLCKHRIYMPTGEQGSGSSWKVIDERTGKVVGSLVGGGQPHNTICHGGRVYMGGRTSRYLFVKDLNAGKLRKVGPSPSASTGVRPFTVNAANTRAYITWTDYRGFSVANLRTGAVIANRNFGPVPSAFKPSAPSHGISLSPSGKTLYVLDAPMHRVEVWSAVDRPVHLKNISIHGP